VHVRGGLARATRNYIDIIDGFIVLMLWFYAERRLEALRTSLHFVSSIKNAKIFNQNNRRSAYFPQQNRQKHRLKQRAFSTSVVARCTRMGLPIEENID
jgi:hypothetical protein